MTARYIVVICCFLAVFPISGLGIFIAV